MYIIRFSQNHKMIVSNEVAQMDYFNIRRHISTKLRKPMSAILIDGIEEFTTTTTTGV